MTTPETTNDPSVDASITVTIDGREVRAQAGELLIKVAQDHGVFIPRFCWHERMKPVGMCRMCLVEVEGMRGLPPACTLTVTDGMVAHTETPAVKQVQDDVLEFLLVNHPLDCPVCDRGGECPLQDQTMSFGPGESRMVEEKRHFPKPIAISDVVLLDRERCIQCARCTRFAEEVAGDPLIAFVDRGAYTQVLNHPEHPFASYFSGNTVQICPVGALTAKPYRFKARPWDLQTAETSCTACAVHCRGALQSASNRLVRLLGVDSDAVNQGWLCDKGRFGFEYVHADERIVDPRVDGAPVSWPTALDAAADALRRAIELHGTDAVALLGGAHGTNEDAYAWARLMKGVVGTDHVDAQLGDGLPAEAVLGLPRATIDDCDRAAAIVLLAPDVKEALPVLHLRIRRAALTHGVPIIDLSPVPTHGLAPHVTHWLEGAPGEAGVRAEQLVAALAGRPPATDRVRAIVDELAAREGPIVVVLGRPNLAERADATARAAAALAELPDVRFLSALARANVHGALEAGLAPGVLPGRVALDGDGAAPVRTAWGRVPARRGLDAEGILRAAVDGKLHVLVLLGADPLADFPDRGLAEQALASVGTIIAVDAFANDSNRRAKVVLPVTLWGEKAGTVTNLEGRVQRVAQKVAPPGTAMDDWRIAAELALRLGTDLDLETVAEVTDELCRVAPAFTGASSALFRAAAEGVVLPVAAHAGEIVLRRRGHDLLVAHGLSWEPIKVSGAPPPGAPGGSTAAAEQSGTGAISPLEPGGETLSDADVAASATAVASARATAAAAGGVLDVLLRWDRNVADGRAPARDAYALRLVAQVPLYDGGRSVVSSPSIAGLERAPELLVSAADLQRLGVTNGTEVRVTSAKGSLTLPVRAVRRVPTGVAVVPFGAAAHVAALIDAGAPVTDLRVETLR